MMDDVDVLRELINDEALTPIEFSNNRNVITLKESRDGPQSEYTVKIQNAPDDIITIKADHFPPPRIIFKGVKGECKRADYVIVARTDRRNWIIYIELKGRKSGSHSEIVQQLRGAKCLVAYCRAIGQAFWSQREFLKENNYEQRFISIKDARLAKEATRRKQRDALHDNPENMRKLRKVSGSKIQFNELIRNP